MSELADGGMPFPFGVNEFTTMPWTFEEDVEQYANLGIGAIELCELKLDDHRYAEQLALIADHRLAISAVQPLVRTFFSSQMQPQPTGLESRTARLRQTIQRIAPFAPGTAFIVNTGAPPKGNVAEASNTVILQLRNLSDLATDHGVRIALEPLHPTAMNTESAIWTVSQALDIVDAVDCSNVGICLDLWNSWQDAGIEDEIRRAGDRIFVLQVSDWRTPRSFGDRIIPGYGSIPLGKLLHAVYETGYRDACTVEIFSQDVPDSLYDTDLRAVVQESRKGLDLVWRNHALRASLQRDTDSSYESIKR